MNIVLYEPEIPPNTGNIIRLGSNTGTGLHLIGPLGFNLEEKSLRRAGLDYHEYCAVVTHDNWQSFMQTVKPGRIIALSTKGRQCYSDFNFREDDFLLFGPETRGLPQDLMQSGEVDEVLRLPMMANSRSLNLSNTVAIVVYEAWRQLAFFGAKI